MKDKVKSLFYKSTFTWCGHAFISVFGSVGIACLFWWGLHIDPVLGLLFGSAFWLGFYLYREVKDELRHKTILKDWRTPSPVDHVRPIEDKVGDLVGPATWFVGCLVWFALLWIVPLW